MNNIGHNLDGYGNMRVFQMDTIDDHIIPCRPKTVIFAIAEVLAVTYIFAKDNMNMIKENNPALAITIYATIAFVAATIIKSHPYGFWGTIAGLIVTKIIVLELFQIYIIYEGVMTYLRFTDTMIARGLAERAAELEGRGNINPAE